MGQGESHPSVLLLCWGTSDENTCSSGSDILVQGWGATEVSPHGFANSELGQAGWGTELGRRAGLKESVRRDFTFWSQLLGFRCSHQGNCDVVLL